jgi:hypothetical protein
LSTLNIFLIENSRYYWPSRLQSLKSSEMYGTRTLGHDVLCRKLSWERIYVLNICYQSQMMSFCPFLVSYACPFLSHPLPCLLAVCLSWPCPSFCPFLGLFLPLPSFPLHLALCLPSPPFPFRRWPFVVRLWLVAQQYYSEYLYFIGPIAC